jgi:hypothetical protein
MATLPPQVNGPESLAIDACLGAIDEEAACLLWVMSGRPGHTDSTPEAGGGADVSGRGGPVLLQQQTTFGLVKIGHS